MSWMRASFARDVPANVECALKEHEDTSPHHPTMASAMKRSTTNSADDSNETSFAREFDARIKSMNDWRGDMLARRRTLIKQADPEVVEEVKWRKPSNPLGVPVWSHDGIICTGETYRDYVKLTFAKGASLPDPSALFN